MRYLDLFEAPLGSFDVVGDFTDRGSFERPDRAILTSPKTVPRVRHAFRNASETIDLVFMPVKFKVTDIQDWAEKIGGVWTREMAERRLHTRLLPRPSSPDAIMLVLTHNEGANRLPLSPWIMAHRMGHAIAFTYEKLFDNIFFTINDVVDGIASAIDCTARDVLYMLGTMQSARQHKLTVNAEFTFECFAQYFMAGKVTFNRFTDPVTVDTKDEGVKSNKHYTAEEANDFIDRTEQSVNRQCQNILATVRGKVIVL